MMFVSTAPHLILANISAPIMFANIAVSMLFAKIAASMMFLHCNSHYVC